MSARTAVPQRLRIGIIGAGATGTVFAALLSSAGHRVTVTARAATVERIASDGIRMSGVFGEVTARPRAAERLDGQDDLVLLCTKAPDAERALLENAHAVAGRPVLVVQNGLDGTTTLVRTVPSARPVAALVLFASSLHGPGTVTVTGPGVTYLGTPSESSDDLALVESLLAPVLNVERVANLRGAQWTKLVVNELNALTAATGLTMQQSIADPRLRLVSTEAMRECVRTGLARGVRFAPLQGLDDDRLRTFERLPLLSATVVPIALTQRMGPVPNPGSTLQSILRGQRTEIDFLAGAVVREARVVGVPAPVNELLLEVVHSVERGASFVPRDLVLADFDAIRAQSTRS